MSKKPAAKQLVVHALEFCPCIHESEYRVVSLHAQKSDANQAEIDIRKVHKKLQPFEKYRVTPYPVQGITV